MIRIEKLQECHCSAVARLEGECFSLPWSESAIRSELSNPLSLWHVATFQEKVIGYVGSQSVINEADMMNLAVDADFRRQHIGEKLVLSLIDHLKQQQISSLTLEVRVSNDAAVSLYEKHGFVQVGRRPGYYQKPKEDALILRKEWAV